MDDQIMESLKSKNNDELRNICRKNNLKGFSKCKKKKDLINFIIESGALNNVNDEMEEVEEVEEIRQEEFIDQTFVDLTIGREIYQLDMDNKLYDNGVNFARIIFSNDDTGYLIPDNNIEHISNFVLKRFGLNTYIIIGYINNSVPRNKIIFNVDFSIPSILFQEYTKVMENYNSKFDIKYIPYQNPNLYENYEMYLRQNEINSDNLRILYHGTEQKNIESILERGFSLATGVRHGEAHGSGIYFSDDLEFALKYADKSRYNRNRYNDQDNPSNKVFVIVSEVYVENMIEGRTNRHLLPNLPNSTKLYDTAVDNVTNPKQFIKKDPKDGINILGHFELTFKEEYFKNKDIRNTTITRNVSTNKYITYKTCIITNCSEHSKSIHGICRKCMNVMRTMPPSMSETVKIRELSDKKSEWYKERFGDTSKYRTYKHECPKCNHRETSCIRNSIMNSSSTQETKNKLKELLTAKEKCKNICICNELCILMSQWQKDVINSKFKSITLKNEMPFEIAIYYKPRHFNVLTDNISNCKKMTTNGLLKPNEELKVNTKQDDEFIIGYFENNEFIVLKIISLDINQEKNIIRM